MLEGFSENYKKKEDGPPSPGESPKNPEKKPSLFDNLVPNFGAPKKESKNKPVEKPKPEPAHEGRERATASQEAEKLLKSWPENGKAEPEMDEAKSKNEFMKAGNPENIFRALENMDVSAKLNAADTGEKYNFTCENKFLVNGRPAAMENIKENLEKGKIETKQISLDFRMEKINGLDANHLKISIPVSDYLNGGREGVKIALLGAVQNMSGAAKQGSESAAAARILQNAQSSEAALKSTQHTETPNRAAGKKTPDTPTSKESRETLFVVANTLNAGSGSQVSASPAGGAIGPAGGQKGKNGTPSESSEKEKNA